MTKPIKFIVTGDLHWRGRNPKARVDDYREAIKFKMFEIYDLATDHDAEGIIMPGDIFDSPGVSLAVLNDLIDILNQSPPVTIYTIAGNHDLYNGSPLSESRTPYGLLTRSGLIEDINNINIGQALIISDADPDNGCSIRLTGESFNAERTDKDIDYYLSGIRHKNPVTENRIRIHVTHGMLLEQSPGYDVRHTILQEVAEQEDAPDVLINGHEHQGFGIKKINDTLFINPGSIGRIKANVANINRQPQVALLTIPEDGEPEAELIPLESARPGEEVLSREHIEEQQRKEEMTEEFLGLLAEEGGSNYMELDDIMNDIAERESIPKDVISEAVARVEKAREEMDHGKRSKCD